MLWSSTLSEWHSISVIDLGRFRLCAGTRDPRQLVVVAAVVRVDAFRTSAHVSRSHFLTSNLFSTFLTFNSNKILSTEFRFFCNEWKYPDDLKARSTFNCFSFFWKLAATSLIWEEALFKKRFFRGDLRRKCPDYDFEKGQKEKSFFFVKNKYRRS